MVNYVTKADLYRRASIIRDELGLSYCDTINSSKELLSALPFLRIEAVPFETAALHGICSFGLSGKADVILLNSHRDAVEQNFDCMHEYIHLHEHRNEHRETFHCFERVSDNQDKFLEWQANEGAAEVLVPYRDFIPRFLFYLEAQSTGFHFSVQSVLAKHYCVTTAVIDNRIRALSYEISQYQQGADLDDIEILSNNQQKKFGIRAPCYIAMCDFPLDWSAVIS